MTVQIRSGKCLRAIAAAALVWGVTPAAQAFDDSLGVLTPLDSAFELGLGKPLFFDTLTFELDAPVAGSFAVKGKGFSLPGVPVVIPPAKDLTFAIYKGGVNLTGFGTAFSGL
ncbi:MAG TPA: hypothetical protein VFM48_14325, partial [Aquabacterium sp.]|nr:hypothetical protein [Aquabacterium sp.]